MGSGALSLTTRTFKRVYVCRDTLGDRPDGGGLVVLAAVPVASTTVCLSAPGTLLPRREGLIYSLQ